MKCMSCIWFKTNAKKNIKMLNLKSSMKEKLIRLFFAQSHKNISIEPKEKHEFNDYLEELKKYILRFGLSESNLLVYNRCSIDYQREVLKIREIQYVYSLFGRMIICDADNNSYGIISYKN